MSWEILREADRAKERRRVKGRLGGREEGRGKREMGGGEERERESQFPRFFFTQFILHTVYY